MVHSDPIAHDLLVYSYTVRVSNREVVVGSPNSPSPSGFVLVSPQSGVTRWESCSSPL